MEVNQFRNRKPDRETESFRMWVTTESERQKLREQGFEIESKGRKVKLLGFKFASDNNKEPFFAWKLKEADKQVLVWKRQELTDTQKQVIAEIEEGLKRNGFRIVDMDSIIDSMSEEADRLKRFEDKCKSEGEKSPSNA